jgi:hypothetical protein
MGYKMLDKVSIQRGLSNDYRYVASGSNGLSLHTRMGRRREGSPVSNELDVGFRIWRQSKMLVVRSRLVRYN